MFKQTRKVKQDVKTQRCQNKDATNKDIKKWKTKMWQNWMWKRDVKNKGVQKQRYETNVKQNVKTRCKIWKQYVKRRCENKDVQNKNVKTRRQ
jgi:hypothetical protein